MKRAMKGEFDLFGEADKLAEYDNIRNDKIPEKHTSKKKLRYIKNFKKAILLVINGASKQFGKNLGVNRKS